MTTLAWVGILVVVTGLLAWWEVTWEDRERSRELKEFRKRIERGYGR